MQNILLMFYYITQRRASNRRLLLRSHQADAPVVSVRKSRRLFEAAAVHLVQDVLLHLLDDQRQHSGALALPGHVLLHRAAHQESGQVRNADSGEQTDQ